MKSGRSAARFVSLVELAARGLGHVRAELGSTDWTTAVQWLKNIEQKLKNLPIRTFCTCESPPTTPANRAGEDASWFQAVANLQTMEATKGGYAIAMRRKRGAAYSMIFAVVVSHASPSKSSRPSPHRPPAHCRGRYTWTGRATPRRKISSCACWSRRGWAVPGRPNYVNLEVALAMAGGADVKTAHCMNRSVGPAAACAVSFAEMKRCTRSAAAW